MKRALVLLLILSSCTVVLGAFFKITHNEFASAFLITGLISTLVFYLLFFIFVLQMKKESRP